MLFRAVTLVNIKQVELVSCEFQHFNLWKVTSIKDSTEAKIFKLHHAEMNFICVHYRAQPTTNPSTASVWVTSTNSVCLSDKSEFSTGLYGLATLNTRRDSLVNCTVRYQQNIVINFFKKRPKRCWTSITFNATAKNEIDFVLIDTPSIFTDSSVIKRFNTGRDYCMVRGSLIINTKLKTGLRP